MPPRSLVDAALRDALRVWRRRLLGRRGRRPALAAALAAMLAAEVIAGRAVAAVVEPALAGAAARSAVVLGLALPSLAAGVAIGAALPAPGVALGERLVASAVPALDRGAAGLVPILPAAVVASLATGPLLVPLAAASPAGALALAPLCALAVAALAVGGAVAASFRAPSALCRGAVVPVLGCLAAAGSLRGPLSGELLRSPTAAAAAALVAVPAAVLALAGWALVHADIQASGVDRGGRSRLPRRPAPALATAVLRLVARRRDVRVALAGACGVGIAGAVAARLVAGSAPGLEQLAVVTAAVAAAPAGLVLGEALRAGGHLWALAPRRALVVGTWVCVGAPVGLAPACTVALACLAVRGPAAAPPAVAALSLGVWLLAVAAGGLAARHAPGSSSQAAALGLFALLAGGLSALLSVAGPRLVMLGLPGPLVASAVLGALVLLATCALAGAARGGI